jgi:hypothetical protein
MLQGLPHSKELGWCPHTQVDPLLAHLPLAPPMPGFLVDRTLSAPLALLLALSHVILYDVSV